MSGRLRLDVALGARGLMPSRSRARDAILRGTITVNEVVARKPGLLVDDDDVIVVDDPASGYMSRAALKLIAGLDAAAVEVEGATCLDVGASTGGFTQVLLERGAARVYAVDVGHEQLHPSLAADPRVASLEDTDARALDRVLVPETIDLMVCDISFVSVTKVLVAPLSLCRAGAAAVILIKPQFEAGRASVGKGGIVTDPVAISRSEATVIAFLADQGWTHRVSVPAPIEGGDGNREIVAVFRRD